MILDDKDVQFALEKAKEISECYRLYVLGGDSPKKSIDDLIWLFGQHCGKKIAMGELNIPAQDLVVRGMYAALSDGSYEIYTLAELGSHEERFVLTKELFHVVMDTEECRNMDLYDHLVDAQASFSIGDSEPNKSVVWEALAEIGAMEFLFPYHDREQLLAASGGNPNFVDIARRYGVPQSYIEMYLSETVMNEFGRLLER